MTFNVEADNSADEIATAIIHLHVPKSFDVVLLRRARIGDVDLAQRNVGIGCHHLIQGARRRFAWGVPVCMEID